MSGSESSRFQERQERRKGNERPSFQPEWKDGRAFSHSPHHPNVTTIQEVVAFWNSHISHGRHPAALDTHLADAIEHAWPSGWQAEDWKRAMEARFIEDEGQTAPKMSSLANFISGTNLAHYRERFDKWALLVGCASPHRDAPTATPVEAARDFTWEEFRARWLGGEQPVLKTMEAGIPE